MMLLRSCRSRVLAVTSVALGFDGLSVAVGAAGVVGAASRQPPPQSGTLSRRPIRRRRSSLMPTPVPPPPQQQPKEFPSECGFRGAGEAEAGRSR